MKALLQALSRLIYVVVTLALFALAFSFIGYAVWGVYVATTSAEEVLSAMLRSVGLVIIALAVSDVGKFLLEEELDRERQLETTGEVRRTLIKFFTIIIIAASLETLVFLFEAGREHIELVIYPAALLVAVAILVSAFALYQRLAASAEHDYRADLSKADAPLDPEKEALERQEVKEEAEPSAR